ncbi:hypothetical protein BJX70DRAFT_361192 [Aspergillus crustosus]
MLCSDDKNNPAYKPCHLPMRSSFLRCVVVILSLHRPALMAVFTLTLLAISPANLSNQSTRSHQREHTSTQKSQNEEFWTHDQTNHSCISTNSFQPMLNQGSRIIIGIDFVSLPRENRTFPSRPLAS